MKIEFGVEFNITNIEFHVYIAMVAGNCVAFLIKNAMWKLGIISIEFFANFFFKIKWNSIISRSTTTKPKSRRLCETRLLGDATFVSIGGKNHIITINML